MKLAGCNRKMNISGPAREDLQCWIAHLEEWNRRNIQNSDSEWKIETDLLLMAHCRGEFTGQRWSPEERELHIKALELIAVRFGI